MTNSEIAMSLAQILSRLDKMEKILGQIAKPPTKAAEAVQEVELRERLKRLTLKRHAVLTASLGEVSYQDIAALMQCDDTTVKLHLKAALSILGIESRSILMASYRHLLDAIPEKEYVKQFGIGKRWWMDRKPDLMAVLAPTKPSANQHSKPAAKKTRSKK